MKKSMYVLSCLIVLLSSCGSSTSNNASQSGNGYADNVSSNTVIKRGNLADGASGDMVAYVNSNVNAIEQARPSIMVIPSDMVLQNFECLQLQSSNGVNYAIRDYSSYLLKDDRFKRLAAYIQDKFNVENYPLNDLEQSLKLLNTQSTNDVANNLSKDTRTQLLSVVRPDIILELDYQTSADGKPSLTSYNTLSSKNLSFTLRAIDAYNSKVVASVTKSNIKGGSTTETIQRTLDSEMPSLMLDIQQYYSDILTRGRDVVIRITLDNKCPFNLSDESIEGDTYADWIIDYIKAHTVKGAYKMVMNTDKELSFTNVRIALLQEDGTQYGVYDWTRDLQKNLRKNLGVRATNRSQGLGEIELTIKNI